MNKSDELSTGETTERYKNMNSIKKYQRWFGGVFLLTLFVGGGIMIQGMENNDQVLGAFLFSSLALVYGITWARLMDILRKAQYFNYLLGLNALRKEELRGVTTAGPPCGKCKSPKTFPWGPIKFKCLNCGHPE